MKPSGNMCKKCSALQVSVVVSCGEEKGRDRVSPCDTQGCMHHGRGKAAEEGR